MAEVPRIISVDDHVVEPPDLWSSRLPAKYQRPGPPDHAPRSIKLGGASTGGGGTHGLGRGRRRRLVRTSGTTTTWCHHS